MSRRQTPNTTPFIPPLASPTVSPQPPLAPFSNANDNAQVPAWATTPQNASNYPIYPSTPYTSTPFIPNMTPASMAGSFYVPSPAAGPQAPLNADGLSSDYIGYPPHVMQQQLHGTPWQAQHASLHPPTPYVQGGVIPMLPHPNQGSAWGARMQQQPPPPPPQQQYPPSAMYTGMMGMGHMALPGMQPAMMQHPWAAAAAAYHTPAVDPWMLPPQQPGPAWMQAQMAAAPPMAPPPPHGPLGRTSAEVGDRVDPFSAGNHYGPVLDPLLIRTVGAHVKINPLIHTLPEDGSDPAHPYIKWNMLFRTNNCQRSTDPPHVSWSAGRDAPATFPRVSSLRLLSPTIPWPIEVNAHNLDVGVLCGEVIEAISDSLYKLTMKEDFECLRTVERRRAVADAYRMNRSRAPGVPGGHLGEGMRRMDFLGKDTMFGGVEEDERWVRGYCGEALPCTFVMKCVRRYPLTEKELKDQEARHRAASAAGSGAAASSASTSSSARRRAAVVTVSDDDDDDDDDDD